jgi:uncharacterized protein YbaP (TraB family)
MRKLFLLFAAVLFLKTGFSQNKEQHLQKSLLWEVSGNGLKKPSYLFGTYHFAGKDFIDSLPVIAHDFEKCTAVAGEFVIDSSAYAKMAPAMMLKGNSLDKILSADEYKLVGDYLQQVAHMNISTFNQLKPAALEVLLLSFTAPKTISPTNPPLDEYFQNEGKKRHAKLLGLETVDDQIDLLLNTPMDEQKRHLLEAVRKKDEQKKEMDMVYTLYRQQDLDGLGKALIADEDYSPEEMDKLLKDRNLKWVQELPAIMKQQPTFITVGAGHLVGEYGLINQLLLKGYTVKAVTSY